jgi:P4 family phage/plasmid primase-like protien
VATKAEAFGIAADLWLAKMEEAGRLVCYSKGSLWACTDGYWTPIIPHEDTMASKLMMEAADMAGISMGAQERALWRTAELKAIPKTGEDAPLEESHLVACTNGTLDPLNGELYEHDPLHYVTRSVAVEYKPGAKCPEWEAALERTLQDKDEGERRKIIAVLQEFFGVAIVGKHNVPRPLKAGLFLYGPTNTGKTSVAKVLRALFDPARVAVSSVEEVSNRFGGSALVGKVAWIGDEATGSKTKPDSGLLKRLLDGDPVQSERKYKDAVPMVFNGPVVWTSNNPLKTDDENEALFQRILSLEFSHAFTSEDAKAQLGATGDLVDWLRLNDEMPGVLNWALEGYHRAVEQGRYTEAKSIRDLRMAWLMSSNPTADFALRFVEPAQGIVNGVRPLAVAMQAYALREHSDRLSKAKAARVAVTVLRSLYPSMKVEKPGTRGAYIVGLKLNDEGVRQVELAREDGAFDVGEKVEINRAGI